MPVVKKRNEQTETRLLLESGEPVELPPALIEPDVVGILQATSQIKPSSIRVRTRLGFLQTFLQLGRKSSRAVPVN